MDAVPPSVAAPRWVTTRVAHPVHDLARSVAFYRDLLRLPSRGGFAGHDGYDGAFFALPGGCELELTTGPAEPRPGTAEDLLVLYLRTLDEVRRTAADLESAGIPTVRPENPYWARWGRTFLDPDGNAVVIAAVAPDPTTAEPVQVQRYSGPREELRELFELAEDSPTQLEAYLHTGRVLVAVAGNQVIGHLQLVDDPQPGRAEIQSMAVREDQQGRGVGAILVQAAVDLLAAESGTSLAVATAAADVGNLRFYQRQGFRLRSVERDAFGPATGYPPGIRLDGIKLRDRVWLDRPIPGELPR
jgi:ribosomal protein S18 acetylase RimI-like enzyme